MSSLILYFFGKNILISMGVTSGLLSYAEVYMRIFGGFIFTQALLNIATVVMRTYGYAKETLAITAGMNILNIITVTIYVFSFSNSPEAGLAGAANSATFARIVALIISLRFVWKHIMESSSLKYIKAFPGQIMKSLLKVGLPSAFENMSYQVSQIAITTFILSNLGEVAFITRSYTLEIINLAIIFSTAIAQANQILVGRLIGKGDTEGAYHMCLKNFRLAFLSALFTGAVLFIFGGLFMQAFTTSAEIIKWGGFTLMVDAFLEPGRTFNNVIINGLRGAGDVIFPAVMAIIFQWGCAVAGAYIIGITLGYGLPGIWFAMLLDEWFRGLIMLYRWRTRKWARRSLIKDTQIEVVEA
jgi:Na+-driven multidrug efflux pump